MPDFPQVWKHLSISLQHCASEGVQNEMKTQTTDETASAPENAQDMTGGYWNEHELVSVSDFRDLDAQYGGGMIRTHYFEKCGLENDGSCLAEIETAMSHASKGYRYIAFAHKSRTPAALRAWRNKWSKRTAPDARVSMFDASVRGSV
jgi:hypothetical protein